MVTHALALILSPGCFINKNKKKNILKAIDLSIFLLFLDHVLVVSAPRRNTYC